MWCSLLIYYSACACLYHLSDRIILCLQSKQKRLQACFHSTCTCMNLYPCLLCSLQSYAYAFYLPKLNSILPRLKSLEKRDSWAGLSNKVSFLKGKCVELLLYKLTIQVYLNFPHKHYYATFFIPTDLTRIICNIQCRDDGRNVIVCVTLQIWLRVVVVMSDRWFSLTICFSDHRN